MGYRSYPIFLLILSAFLLLDPPLIAAQESGAENEKTESTTVFSKDLGRHGMIVTHNIDGKSTLDFMWILGLEFLILLLQIGDETFVIAALAMRPKSIVLSGALSALFVMMVLSTGLGRIVPNFISRKHTNSAATGYLFSTLSTLQTCDSIEFAICFFGLRLLYIAWRSDPKASQKKEMEEVEEKLEAGQGKTAYRRFFSRFCTPIFLELFILTFLAEWGDRSQIATIALATHKNAIGVAVGATIGHTVQDMYIVGSGRRKHVSIKDLTRDSCYHWRIAFPLLLFVLLFLSSSIRITL